METEANDPDHLVNYDNDNDIDDLGYESEVYLDEEEEYNTLCFQVIDDVDKSTMYLLYCT
ncbi:hypothetical protein Tco_0486204, partial [Tanacetum coccineum]